MEETGLINGYSCKCGWIMNSITLNKGVTPQFVNCMGDQSRNPNLAYIGKHQGQSHFYIAQQSWLQKSKLIIGWAWIRPNISNALDLVAKSLAANEIVDAELQEAAVNTLLTHLRKGGLMLVPIEEAFKAIADPVIFGSNAKADLLYLEELYDNVKRTDD